MNLLIKNIRIVSPAEGTDKNADILIEDGIIKKIGKVKNEDAKDREVMEGKGFTCVPGLYDMHVHLREPGQTHKEDILTGAESAMNGGFTGVMCMPNTNPPIDSAALVSSLRQKAREYLIDLDIAPCVSKGRKGEELAPILSMHAAGAAGFTDDGSPVANPELMRRAMEYIAQVDSVFIQHAEDMALTAGGQMNEGYTATLLGIKGIPAISETIIIARDVLITKYIKGARYHVQHISCADSVKIIRDAKATGINATCEVCPHHFVLTDEACDGYNTNAKMNPPLRTQSDIDEILQGLKDNTIDVICTDHAPHTEYEKNSGFYEAPFGIVGLETAVGLAYTYLVEKGVISFEEMILKMSINPRKILKLPEVKIKEGEKANLTILDTNSEWTVDKSKFKSKSRNTPFEGYKLKCRPFAVINNGKIYYSDYN